MIATSSLFIGYTGLRVLTLIHYLIIQRSEEYGRKVTRYFGTSLIVLSFLIIGSGMLCYIQALLSILQKGKIVAMSL